MLESSIQVRSAVEKQQLTQTLFLMNVRTILFVKVIQLQHTLASQLQGFVENEGVFFGKDQQHFDNSFNTIMNPPYLNNPAYSGPN